MINSTIRATQEHRAEGRPGRRGPDASSQPRNGRARRETPTSANSAAPTQAPMPSTSRTKPRKNASRAEIASTRDDDEIDPGHRNPATVRCRPGISADGRAPSAQPHRARPTPATQIGEVPDLVQPQAPRGPRAGGCRGPPGAAGRRRRTPASPPPSAAPRPAPPAGSRRTARPRRNRRSSGIWSAWSAAAEASAAATARSAAGSPTRRPPATFR